MIFSPTVGSWVRPILQLQSCDPSPVLARVFPSCFHGFPRQRAFPTILVSRVWSLPLSSMVPPPNTPGILHGPSWLDVPRSPEPPGARDVRPEKISESSSSYSCFCCVRKEQLLNRLRALIASPFIAWLFRSLRVFTPPSGFFPVPLS